MKPLFLAAALVLGACGPGGGDDQPPGDAGPAGLTLTWESRPEEIPMDEPEDGVRIQRAAFHLGNLRVVGDAGPIALGQVTVEWAKDVSPRDIVLTDAPSGLYSRCLFDLTGTDFAYEITGTVRDASAVDVPFTVRDRMTVSISVDFSITLSDGRMTKIPIRYEVDKLVDAIDFEQVAKVNNAYLVEDGHPELAKVRAVLDNAIRVHL